MRPIRATLTFALLVSFALSGTVRADDDSIMSGGNLLQGQQQAQQQQGPVARTAPVQQRTTLPNEVEVDLREQIAELQAQITELKNQMTDMQRLQASDKAAFERRMADDEAKLRQLEQQQRGMNGRIDQVQRDVQLGRQQNQNGTWNPNTNNGNQNGTWNGNNTGNNGPWGGDQSQQNKPLTFWEKLLLRVAEGLGNSLTKWMDRKMGVVYNNASNASTTLGNQYPEYQTEIDRRIADAVNRELGRQGLPNSGGYGNGGNNNGGYNNGNNNGGYNNGNNNGGYNNYPNNGNNGGINNGNMGGNMGGNQTVITQESRTVTMRNGQVTQVSTTTTRTVIQRLPVVTDQYGTHVVINLTLGD